MPPKIGMNVTTTFYGNVVNDIKIAREAGFAGIELQAPKFYRYLDAGLPASYVPSLLGGLAVTGMGAIQNIERQGPYRESYLAEVKQMCQVAVDVGAPIVQLCTGPSDWTVVRDYRSGKLSDDDLRYHGTLGTRDDDALNAVARNVSEAAMIAADHGLGIYVEPLAWTNVNRCAQLMRILEKVNRENVGIALDFWHFWCVGDTLEEVAAIPAERIFAVHVSDATAIDRETEIPNVTDHRDVVTGGGSLPLQEWVDAVKSTGYNGWWINEMFATKANEHDFLEVARTMRGLLEILVW
jgi:sugar phosphate isomerase/epimerase